MIRRKSSSSNTTTKQPPARKLIRKHIRKAARKSTAAPKPVIPPLGAPVGTRITSGDYKGFHEVPAKERPKNGHPFFRNVLMPDSLRANTVYVVDFKHNKFGCMKTTQPDGTVVAWDICRRCHNFIGTCVCHEIKTPEYIINWMPKKSIEDELAEKIAAQGKPKGTIRKTVKSGGKKLIRKK